MKPPSVELSFCADDAAAAAAAAAATQQLSGDADAGEVCAPSFTSVFRDFTVDLGQPCTVAVTVSGNPQPKVDGFLAALLTVKRKPLMESSRRLSHLSVCRSVCGNTADWIRMPFRMVSGVGRGMGVLDGGGESVTAYYSGQFNAR